MTETEHPPHLRLDFHTHEPPSLTLLVSGSQEELFDSCILHCCPGSLLIKPRGASHANRYGSRITRAVIIVFANELFQDLGVDTTLLDDLAYFEGGIVNALACQLWMEARSGREACRIRLQEIAGLMLTATRQRVCYESLRSAGWLKRTREYLDSHFCDDISLSDVAAVAQVHPAYLTRSFRQLYGCTVAQTIRRKRLDKAITLLSNAEKGIKEIAVECGFYDQSHLSNALRREVGAPPRAIRNSARN